MKPRRTFPHLKRIQTETEDSTLREDAVVYIKLDDKQLKLQQGTF